MLKHVKGHEERRIMCFWNFQNFTKLIMLNWVNFHTKLLNSIFASRLICGYFLPHIRRFLKMMLYLNWIAMYCSLNPQFECDIISHWHAISKSRNSFRKAIPTNRSNNRKGENVWRESEIVNKRDAWLDSIWVSHPILSRYMKVTPDEYS